MGSFKALKEENARLAAEEATNLEAAANLEPEEEELEIDAELENEGEEGAAKDLLMQTDEESGKSIPLSAHIKKRTKLQGRLTEKDGEIDRLKAEVARLNTVGSQAPAKVAAMPTLDSVGGDEVEYQKKMAEWAQGLASSTVKTELTTHGQQQQTQAAAKEMESTIDGHYDRADVLCSERGISPEAYKEADTTVRAAFDLARPGHGDTIADQLIGMIGDDSEKVMFYLGRNKAQLAELQSTLLADPSGLKAAVVLGQLKTKLNGTTRKRSHAPPPDTRLGGDAEQKPALSTKKAKAAYAKAKTPQERWDARKAAKAAGIDVTQ